MSEVQRAYSVLHVKNVEDRRRTISGIATTPTPDRMGDVIDPLGVTFNNPLPLLLYHDKTRPVGLATLHRPTKDGIAFTAEIADVATPGPLKDRIDEALLSLKAGLIRGVSIGFRPLEDGIKPLKGGLRFTRSEVVELSLVTIPANVEATIHAIKSFDARATPGTAGPSSSPTPGVSGSRKDAPMSVSISDQLSAAKTDLKVKSARLEELLRLETTDGELGTDEAAERDSLTDAVKAQVKHVDHLTTLEAAQAAQAQALTVKGAPAPARTTTVTAPRIEVPALEKGTLFARYAMAVAAGRGSYSDTIAYAKRWDGQTPQVSAYIKAVAGTTATGSGVWGGELVDQTNLVSEFVELLRPATILGRLPAIRRVPFNVRIPVQTGGSTVNWVGEAAVKPVTELDFSEITLGHHKIAGIVVLSDELVRFSRPGAEETVRRDLVEQIARFMDAQFLDTSVTAGANNPASITNGVASQAASGTDADALYGDLFTALATFDTNSLGTENVVILTTPAIARGISMLRSTMGQFEFPGMTPQGGTLLGFPVIVSASVPTGMLVLVKADEILMADDGAVTLDASNQATLDMLGGTSPNFNLWQRNCVAIRAERWVTWAKRRAGVVAIITEAAYTPVAGSV